MAEPIQLIAITIWERCAASIGVCATLKYHLQLNYSYTVSLCEALILSTRTNVSQFVSQYDVSTEFLLSIGKVKHSKCLYTYLYNITYMYHLSVYCE